LIEIKETEAEDEDEDEDEGEENKVDTEIPSNKLEPKAVDVVIDANNQCQGGQDINFAITGFKVQGSVRSEACESEKDAATKGMFVRCGCRG